MAKPRSSKKTAQKESTTANTKSASKQSNTGVSKATSRRSTTRQPTAVKSSAQGPVRNYRGASLPTKDAVSGDDTMSDGEEFEEDGRDETDEEEHLTAKERQGVDKLLDTLSTTLEKGADKIGVSRETVKAMWIKKLHTSREESSVSTVGRTAKGRTYSNLLVKYGPDLKSSTKSPIRGLVRGTKVNFDEILGDSDESEGNRTPSVSEDDDNTDVDGTPVPSSSARKRKRVKFLPE